MRIYVGLLGDGVDVWRPILAEDRGNNVYLILSQAVPPDEEWQFLPGSFVRCKERQLDNCEIGFVAVEQLPIAPDSH